MDFASEEEMERFPLKSSAPKMTTTYQSVYKKGSGAGAGAGNGRSAAGEEDVVDLTPAGAGPGGETTPTSHGTFQLYEHTGPRHSAASANSYIAQYFSSSTGKDIVLTLIIGCFALALIIIASVA